MRNTLGHQNKPKILAGRFYARTFQVNVTVVSIVRGKIGDRLGAYFGCVVERARAFSVNKT
jgi:hypothetical protein